MLNAPREPPEFSIWYLRESGLITRGDNGSCMITAPGVDFLEKNGLQERFDGAMRLPAGSGQQR